MLTSMTKEQERFAKLLPNGVPKYVRCYDDGGKSIDRYTVVFTKKRPGGVTLYLGMSSEPFHPANIIFSFFSKLFFTYSIH